MTQYSFTTAFSDADLERFYAAGSNVVVARPLTGGNVNVAWLVYRPLRKNFISYDDGQYGLYASNSNVVDGARLNFNAWSDPRFALQSDLLYTMIAAGTITGPVTSGGTAGAFSIRNQYVNDKGYLTFGLSLPAIVDGERRAATALSATAVLLNSTGVMAPLPAICLWVQPNLASSTVVTTISGPLTKVALDPTTRSADLTYNASSGTFFDATNGGLVTIVKARV
jgi:hypothetical protein